LSDEAKREAVNILFEQFCVFYQIQGGTLTFALGEGENSGRSGFNRRNRNIHLEGKFSMITFLHLFAMLNGARDGLEAQRWAINLFRKIFPVSFSRLKFQDGMFIKTERTNLPQMPETPNTPEGQ
jgi:hypothetical protein